MKKLNRKGFTLVELLAVIVVTSLVLGLSGYGIINAYHKSKEKSLVLNQTSVFQAARIYSSEADSADWKQLDNLQYFCTTIQRLKNAGLLKKEAKGNSEKFSDGSLIVVERNSATFNVEDIEFIEADNNEIKNLCNIKFFTIHYEYNVENEEGNVPNDQIGEVCTNDNCFGVNISSYKPKRDNYRFVGWNTESDGSGMWYSNNSPITSYSENTVILYAQWVEDSYTIKYNGNSGGVTGSTADTKCFNSKNCTLSSNGFIKTGYEFVKWNTESDGSGISYSNEQIVNNITSSDEITLYAIWKAKYKVIIKYNVGNNGQIRNSTTSSTGVNYLWKTDSNGIISRSVDGGPYTDEFFDIAYDSSNDLVNYNNGEYIYITNNFYSVSSGSIWKCTSGECLGNVYNQTDQYSSGDFCDASASNCTVVLTVNWENKDLLSPIITSSDGKASGKWHNEDYNLTITSENSGTVSYEYKVGNGSYQNYSNVITPPEGINTYTARSKVGNQYSGEVSYVSKLDKTPPSVPTITNPTNGNWTKDNFKLTLESTDSLSGIAYYQYSYDIDIDANKEWTTYKNSASETFETTDFTKERNQKVFVRACDKAGNCSASSYTYIRIDKTAPKVTFTMLNNGNAVSSNSNYYSSTPNDSLIWFTFAPTLKWTVSDSGSGVKNSAGFHANSSGSESLNESFSYNSSLKKTSSEDIFSKILYEGGYRKLKIDVCDKVDNCVYDTKYFKYYSNDIVSKYVNVKTKLNCWNNTGKGNALYQYSCGTLLSNLVKTYTGNWYYNTSSNCYVDGTYLVNSKPSCSSGSGTPGIPNCAQCKSKAECDNVSGYTKSCELGWCVYKSGDQAPIGCE